MLVEFERKSICGVMILNRYIILKVNLSLSIKTYNIYMNIQIEIQINSICVDFLTKNSICIDWNRWINSKQILYILSIYNCSSTTRKKAYSRGQVVAVGLKPPPPSPCTSGWNRPNLLSSERASYNNCFSYSLFLSFPSFTRNQHAQLWFWYPSAYLRHPSASLRPRHPLQFLL
jgi:hypothetical protein